MSLPAIAFRTASFALTMALVGLAAYPVLAALAYVGFLIASATGNLNLGGPLAGPLLVLLGAAVGAICVAIAAPAALAARAAGGLKGVLAGAAVLVVLAGVVTWSSWTLFDMSGNPLVATAVVLAAATPAALVLALSDVLADRVTRLVRSRSSVAPAEV